MKGADTGVWCWSCKLLSKQRRMVVRSGIKWGEVVRPMVVASANSAILLILLSSRHCYCATLIYTLEYAALCFMIMAAQNSGNVIYIMPSIRVQDANHSSNMRYYVSLACLNTSPRWYDSETSRVLKSKHNSHYIKCRFWLNEWQVNQS